MGSMVGGGVGGRVLAASNTGEPMRRERVMVSKKVSANPEEGEVPQTNSWYICCKIWNSVAT